MSHQLLICALDPTDEIEAAVSFQMQPFDENGEWFKDGTRWDWYVIGGRYENFRGLLSANTVTRGELNKEQLKSAAARKAGEIWAAYQAETDKSDFIREYIYGLKADDTLATLIQRQTAASLHAGVFLREKRWYENQRMGWFGGAATTECEAAGHNKGKCIVGKIEQPPCIIGFNESPEHWREYFYSRFIEPLPPETILVSVDYHV